MIKMMQFKMKELVSQRGTASSGIAISEKQFLDVQHMIKMTGSQKLPPALQQQKDVGEFYSFRNRNIAMNSGLNSSMSQSIEQSAIDKSAGNSYTGDNNVGEHFVEAAILSNMSGLNEETLPEDINRVSQHGEQFLPEIKNGQFATPNSRNHSASRRSAHTINPSFIARKRSIEQSAHSLRTIGYPVSTRNMQKNNSVVPKGNISRKDGLTLKLEEEPLQGMVSQP